MPQNLDFFSRGGEMGALIRAHDWDSSPLGPPQHWPDVLIIMLRIVLTSNHPMFIWWGPELLQFYNDAYRQTMGPERHPSALGQRGRECWEEIWPIIGPDIERVLAGQGATWHEDRLVPVTRHGRREDVWWTYGYSPIEDRGGVHGVLVICNDVTAEHRSHVQLTRLNERLLSEIERREKIERRQAFQLQLADRLRLPLSVSQLADSACQLLGQHLGLARVSYAEIGSGSVEVIAGWSRDGARSGELPLNALQLQQLRAGVMVQDEGEPNDAPCRLALPLLQDGALQAVLLLQHCMLHRWTEDEIQTAQEMAERCHTAIESVRAQTELDLVRNQSSYVFNTMTEGFAVVDSDWTMLQINAEGLRLTRRSAAQLLGRSHWQAFPELQGTVLEAVYKRVKSSGAAEVVEHLYRYADGESLWIEVRVYPALDGGLAFFFRDISERKAVEQKLKETDHRKDVFLAMLAHELRNPLAPVSAAADVLRVMPGDEQRVRQASEIIGRQVRHMSGMIDDLMDVSRVTRGLVSLETARLDARHIVADAVEQVAPLLENRHHKLAMQLPSSPVHLCCDQKRLIQVITNLLNNAAKYTPDGGHISITLASEAEQAIICIKDNGIGMSRDMVESAFELFVQAERTSDRAQGGLGIGLALVKSLVDLHGGTISASSEGPGQGSTFTLRLPRVQAGEQRSDTLPEPTPCAAAPGLRLMVVDDNIDAARMLALCLEAAGHHVFVEHESIQALERARQEAPDACVVDIGLPQMDGNELARQLRRQPETAGALLIAATGYGQEQDRRAALDAGFDHHLVKPVNMEHLLSLLIRPMERAAAPSSRAVVAPRHMQTDSGVASA